MVVYSEVRKNTYFDSVTLMLVSSKLSGVPGVSAAAVMMGSDHNKSLMIASGVLHQEKAAEISPNDLVVGISAENQEAVDAALLFITEQFAKKKKGKTQESGLYAKSIQSALEKLEDANLAVVSLPGRFAKTQALKLLKANVHVLLFSDNVSVKEEIELKKYALGKGLLMMGPDCGTAIVNGIALGFANVVRRGSIGLIGASGTGLQEISSLIDLKGGGVSQVLGTGGRDLKEEVGGLMMLQEIEALGNDPETQLIGIVSKIPDEAVLGKIVDLLGKTGKPVVACFLGYSARNPVEGNIHYVGTLDQAADALVALAQKENPKPEEAVQSGADIEKLAGDSVKGLQQGQKYIRGLFSGGTLCQESLLIVSAAVQPVYSNIHSSQSEELVNVEASRAHTLLDMGDDYFTDGIPHPMIDFRLRSERIRKEAQDPETAVILLDCVLGYGSHEDPAGALVAAIKDAKQIAGSRKLVFVSSVTGTEGDPQVRSSQIQKLQDAGVIVMPSCAQAARLAAGIAEKLAGK